jgi:hypothetical protein
MAKSLTSMGLLDLSALEEGLDEVEQVANVSRFSRFWTESEKALASKPKELNADSPLYDLWKAGRDVRFWDCYIYSMHEIMTDWHNMLLLRENPELGRLEIEKEHLEIVNSCFTNEVVLKRVRQSSVPHYQAMSIHNQKNYDLRKALLPNIDEVFDEQRVFKFLARQMVKEDLKRLLKHWI